MIPYGRQSIDASDEAAVLEVLRSDFLTQGPKLEAFEAALAERTGARHCLVVSNATTGLHLVYEALGIAGREGITSPNTFVSTSNAMAYCGIKPRFADIDADSFNVSVSAVEAMINAETALVAPVHFAGLPADMQAISRLAKEYGLRVVEDAAHAIGSEYADGGRVGDCRFSDATVFSFHPVKTMTTGEGGAITTNDSELYEKLRLLRSHGIERRREALKVEAPGPWYYEQHHLGFNYRMTEMQAALGLSQLNRLDIFLERRSRIIEQYHEGLAGLSWLRLPLKVDHKVCYHLFVVQIDFAQLAMSRAQVMATLAARGVGTQVHYIPVHTQPWYREQYDHQDDCPVAEAYYEKALSIPLYPAMTDEDVEAVIQAVRALGS